LEPDVDEAAAATTTTAAAAVATAAAAATTTSEVAENIASGGVNVVDSATQPAASDDILLGIRRRRLKAQLRKRRRRNLEHLAILSDVPLTEGILTNLSALDHLKSLALLGYFMTGANLRVIASSIGENLKRLETWIPFKDQNVLIDFSELEHLRLVLMANEEEVWNVVEDDPEAPTYTAINDDTAIRFPEGISQQASQPSLTPVQMRFSSARQKRQHPRYLRQRPLSPRIPVEGRSHAWSRSSMIKDTRIFLEIDPPPLARAGGDLDMNPFLAFVAKRYGTSLRDFRVDVGPRRGVPLTKGIEEIVQFSPQIENLTVFGGRHSLPVLDIAAFRRIPSSMKSLSLLGIELFSYSSPISIDIATKVVQSKLGEKATVEIRPSGWNSGFEEWHKECWSRM